MTNAATSLSPQSASSASAPAEVVGAPIPVAHPNADSLTADDVDAARDILANLDGKAEIQNQFTQTVPPKPANNDFLRGIAEFISDVVEFLAKWLEPLGPFLPWIIYPLIIGLLLLLLSPLVRMAIATKFERLFQRDRLVADAPWRPTEAAAAALLEEIDALAANGEYDAAVHHLLKRSVADLNAFRPDLVRKHFSARDICKHPLLPPEARPAFEAITRWAEKSYFAGIPVGREGFEACRQAYVDFVTSEPLKPESRTR